MPNGACCARGPALLRTEPLTPPAAPQGAGCAALAAAALLRHAWREHAARAASAAAQRSPARSQDADDAATWSPVLPGRAAQPSYGSCLCSLRRGGGDGGDALGDDGRAVFGARVSAYATRVAAGNFTHARLGAGPIEDGGGGGDTELGAMGGCAPCGAVPGLAQCCRPPEQHERAD